MPFSKISTTQRRLSTFSKTLISKTMAISEFSKICMICMVTLFSLPMASQQSPQPLLTYDTFPKDDETISLAAASSPSQSSYPENPAPEARGYLASSTDPDEYNPPPPPPQQPYIDTFAPESQNNQLLSPDYPPSPSPVYFQDYPSPPSYIEVQAPESYYGYSPIQAPIPPPSFEQGSSQFSETDDLTSFSNLAPQPNVLASNYRAEDENGELDELESDEAYYPDQNKNRSTMAGFVLGAVCLVGLAGFVYKKKKNSKSKADYE